MGEPNLDFFVPDSAPEAPASPEQQTTAAPANTEAAPPPAEKKPEISDLEYSSKIAHLTKQEKALIAKKQELSSLQDEVKSYQSLKELAKQNPMAILDHFGLDYNSLTDAILSQQDPETKRFSELQSQIEALRQEKVEEAKKAEANKVTEAENAYKWGIEKIATANSDEYELVNHYGAYDTVYEVCKQYYEQTNTMLDLKEALSLVEKDLEEQLNPVINLKKVKTKFAPVQTNPAATQSQAPQAANTASNEPFFSRSKMPPQGASSAPVSPARTDAERRERALKWLE